LQGLFPHWTSGVLPLCGNEIGQTGALFLAGTVLNELEKLIRRLRRRTERRRVRRDDHTVYPNLSGIYYLLEQDQSPDAVPRSQNRLWELALHMEHRSLDRTGRRLEEARQSAKDALSKALQDPSTANCQALEQKLRELEQAIQKRPQRRKPNRLMPGPST
jgi:hypothetical protein